MALDMPDRMCTRQDLEAALRSLGVTAGMILVVHSSMKSLGWVPGGARSVVDALLSVLGLAGTLVMPAQCSDNSNPEYWRHPPVPEAWWAAIRESTPPYDPACSPPVGMGAVVDCFRAYPGVRRSNHPTCSFMARGPAAEILLARHDLACSLGEDSPCGALDRADASVLLLGVDFDRCTVMHLAEYRSNCRTFFQQSSAVWQDGRPAIVSYPEMDGDTEDFLAIGRELEQAGLVSQVTVSQARLRLCRVRDVVRTAENWLGRNCLHRLAESDRNRVLDYLRNEPEYNLFIIGDIENFGMATDFMDVMAFENENGLDSILLRYHQSYIPYSQNLDFNPAPLLSALRTPNLRFLSGKQTVLDRLKPYLDDLKWRYSYLMKLGRGELTAFDNRPEPPDVRLKVAEVADVPDLVDFLESIAEFSRAGSRQDRVKELATAIEGGSSHYYLYEHHGAIIATAGTSAENSISAMVVAVATRTDWRGQGLASRLVTALAADLLPDKLEYLCLFYDNPAAGRIYRRLGFQDAGQWVMAQPITARREE